MSTVQFFLSLEIWSAEVMKFRSWYLSVLEMDKSVKNIARHVTVIWHNIITVMHDAIALRLQPVVTIYNYKCEITKKIKRGPERIAWRAKRTSAWEAKGLFTRREGYPCAKVTLARGLKIDRVYKQILQVKLPYHPSQLNQLCWRDSSCVTFFVRACLLGERVTFVLGLT